MSQPDAVAEDVTVSQPPAAIVPPKEGAAMPSPFPFGLRTPAAVYASSVSTNLSAYEDLPGHHLISICNLIASPPDSLYLDSADEEYVYVRGCEAPEWDYSGLRDREAFLLFQAATDYYLTCSDDSSEGDYEPTRECFLVELEEHNDDAPNATHAPVAVPIAHIVPRPATPVNSGLQQAQLAQLQELEAKLQEER